MASAPRRRRCLTSSIRQLASAPPISAPTISVCLMRASCWARSIPPRWILPPMSALENSSGDSMRRIAGKSPASSPWISGCATTIPPGIRSSTAVLRTSRRTLRIPPRADSWARSISGHLSLRFRAQLSLGLRTAPRLRVAGDTPNSDPRRLRRRIHGHWRGAGFRSRERKRVGGQSFRAFSRSRQADHDFGPRGSHQRLASHRRPGRMAELQPRLLSHRRSDPRPRSAVLRPECRPARPAISVEPERAARGCPQSGCAGVLHRQPRHLVAHLRRLGLDQLQLPEQQHPGRQRAQPE